MWVDPMEKPVWRNETTADKVVLYTYCKGHPWEAAASIDFCAFKFVRPHLEEITHSTTFTTAAPFTMIGLGRCHPPFESFYCNATHHIPDALITSDAVLMVARYQQYFLSRPGDSPYVDEVAALGNCGIACGMGRDRGLASPR